MESILHIEPISRAASVPVCVGYSDYLSYGESKTEDGESTGTPAAIFKLGCPLEPADMGTMQSVIPLIKTIECKPNLSSGDDFVYSETLHYQDRQNRFIPYRTKIRSGQGTGMRLTHIPSLNAVRTSFTGFTNDVCDPRSDIISELLVRDSYFDNRRNCQLKDWLVEEFAPKLTHHTASHVCFGMRPVSTMINNTMSQIRCTPSDMSVSSMNSLIKTVVPELDAMPYNYASKDNLSSSLSDFQSNLGYHNLNFGGWGQIRLRGTARVDYNPFAFREICDLLDVIPLTNFNIDLVITPDNEIAYYYEHSAANQFNQIKGFSTLDGTAAQIIEGYFDAVTLNGILDIFIRCHSDMTEEIANILERSAIKIKIIKTMGDEAAILLYRYNSHSDEPPLCGVYFDIALLSLAPMSVINESMVM